MALSGQLSRLCLRLADEFNEHARSDAPGLARAWVSFGVQKKRIHCYCAYNVPRVVRLKTGHFRVFFSAPMPHAQYCWHAAACSPRTPAYQRGWLRWLWPRAQPPRLMVSVTATSVESLDLVCATLNGRYSDSSVINLVIYT